MKSLNLSDFGMLEITPSESRVISGGFLPVIAYGICWGIMIGCSLVAAGMKEALNEKQASGK